MSLIIRFSAHKNIIKVMPFFQPLEWYYPLMLQMRIAFHANALSALINELSALVLSVSYQFRK